MKFFIYLLFCSTHFASEYVTANIQGQLGNQLFQTAAVIGYALDHGSEARFPSLKNAINAELNLRYVLHRLNISEFPEGTAFEPLYELADSIYCHAPYNPGRNICFNGYFPSEKYFSRHSAYIKNLFAPTEDLLDQIYAKYGDILHHPTVAVHIRTFFPDSIDPNNGVGRTNWDYFINAIECFPEDYIFLIFSDSYDWTHLFFPRIREKLHFIQGNPHYFDFYLMSLCNHQIISPRSTFSWWAAWLNKHPDKIVIRPDDHWLPDEAFPDTWRKISLN